ncbi:NADH dehydrogenase (ubiquinone) chain 5 [Geobacillus kaustophilus HTA426]|uniref:Probable inorganic carbon transporter subunit DabB n=1 Tax=Geobacillus kaustophilus (strain HTA426) TaxID=235909 RepID=Q5L2V3_GEOKA|nr:MULTISPECIES: NADH dehydrogenase subunit 5 [Geobacillus thermoleovorans group]OQP13271.1 NADH-quinone oxidoreductase subunit L [Geobacillus thermoleovorans]QNU23038.1 NADH dehydrogenase subunit 5 [Geobacillus thermoleovorans]BAD74727.1 NADH dehydrogenase (ubiquinone) chain 5 [Geobacillus kaustophilus HTA426]
MGNEWFAWGWLAAIAVVFLSAIVWLFPRVSERYVHVHVWLLLLPGTAALFGWIGAGGAVDIGPWRFDATSWLSAVYISLLSWAIQRFAVRYLHGDRRYRLYFSLLTWTSFAASLTWAAGDLRLIAVCWGLPLVGLVALTALKKEWEPAQFVAWQMGMLFLASWIAVALTAVWLGARVGEWTLVSALSAERLARLALWERAVMSGLLMLAAVIPAGQWPFHRWLMESAVTPTPVSAVMHAGLVNAGGLLLWRFSPLFNETWAHVALFLIAFASILIGTGVSFVHVDYKRQLVGSTMAQMGVMLVQCALGAYGAAVVHLVLHGLFKATLFLQSGSVVPRVGRAGLRKTGSSRPGGIILGVLFGWAFWQAAPHEPARLLSALLLAASATVAWGRLTDFREGRWLGFAVVVALALASETVRHQFMALLHNGMPSAFLPPASFEWLVCALFVAAALVAVWIANRRSSMLAIQLYMWLVHLGEPRPAATEAHPRYLASYLKEGMAHE